MVHESASTGYTEEAGAYAKGRPSYHPDVVERFVIAYGHGAVVELGAGTGIFTSHLVENGVSPVVVEPVAEMRAQLQAALPGVVALAGTAEATGLDDDSADNLLAAQAFHWFDYPAALDEIARVLRPGGHLVCVWNVRDESVPWVQAWSDTVNRYGGDTPRHHTMEWRRAIDGDARFVAVEDFSVDNPVPSSPELAAARALSTSFIAALDDDAKQTVVDEIATITAPLGASFPFPYRSELQAWVYRP